MGSACQKTEGFGVPESDRESGEDRFPSLTPYLGPKAAGSGAAPTRGIKMGIPNPFLIFVTLPQGWPHGDRYIPSGRSVTPPHTGNDTTGRAAEGIRASERGTPNSTCKLISILWVTPKSNLNQDLSLSHCTGQRVKSEPNQGKMPVKTRLSVQSVYPSIYQSNEEMGKCNPF